VRGHVVDKGTNAALAGAEISAAGATAIARTDARGDFVLTGVPIGEARIVVRRLGYQPFVWQGPVTEDDPITLAVALSPAPSGSLDSSGFPGLGVGALWR
jgi:hypothetical protein